MTAVAEVVLTVATILTVDGSTAVIDQGIAAGLRAGDRGQVLYELHVGASDRVVRIPFSQAEVVNVEETRAWIRVRGSQPALPGFRVEIEIPSGRLEPPTVLVALAEHSIELGQYERALRQLGLATLHLVGHPLFSLPSRQELEAITGSQRVALAMETVLGLRARAEAGLGEVKVASRDREVVVPKERAVVHEQTAAVVAEETVVIAEEKDPNPVPRPPLESMARISGGAHEIGVELENARFYDQQPRHTRQLQTFRIDRVSVTKLGYQSFRINHVFSDSQDQEFAVGLTFDEAQAFCRWRSARLPTEFEWEVAAKTPGAIAVSLLEWTDSWYEPYPGNTFPEPKYGKIFRVLRGMPEGRVAEATVRRFLDPLESGAMVGFRCVDTTASR